MPAVHRIRLRGGWKIERRDDGSSVFERPFGSPRTLDPEETVWLVCDGVPSDGVVMVNGQVIGNPIAGVAFEGEVATLLPRNTVRFELNGAGDAELGEVALEFRTKE